MNLNGIKGTFWLLVGGLPVVAPVALAVFSFILTLLLIFGVFTDLLIILISTFIVLPVIYYIYKKYNFDGPGNRKEKNIINILMIVFVLAWILFNSFYVARSVFIDRDPGIYNVAGKHLVNENKAEITGNNVFGDSTFIAHEGGVWPSSTEGSNADFVLNPQSSNLLPGLLGASGRLGGETALFRANVIIGGFALLAFYGFCRLIVKPRWAALAALTLSATMPFIYFSRDTYTEILSLTFVFGGLSLLWMNYQRLPKINLPYWFLAGLIAGAPVLNRSDGYFIYMAFLSFFVLAIFFENKVKTSSLIRSSIIFSLGAGVAILAGWYEMLRSVLPLLIYSSIVFLALLVYLFRKYVYKFISEINISRILILSFLLIWIMLSVLSDRGGHVSDVRLQLLFISFATLLWLVASYIKKSHIRLPRFFKNINYVAVISGLVVTWFLFLVSRPLWIYKFSFLENFLKSRGPSIHSVNATQKYQGLPVQNKNYSENSVEWIEWYIGGALVILAVIGMIIMVHKIIKEQKLIFLAPLLLIFLSSTAYFLAPHITADHIWASRRFLPVIIPGFIILGIFAICFIVNKYSKNLSTLYKSLLFIFIACLVLVYPLKTSKPLLFAAEKEGNYQAVTELCKQLPENAAVLWLDRGVLALAAVQTSRSYCQVDSMGYTYGKNAKDSSGKIIIDKSLLAKASKEARSRNLVPIIAMRGNRTPDLESAISNNLTEIVTYSNKELEQTLLNPPRFLIEKTNSLQLGYIMSDGSIQKF